MKPSDEVVRAGVEKLCTAIDDYMTWYPAWGTCFVTYVGSGWSKIVSEVYSAMILQAEAEKKCGKKKSRRK
jgi:hypothetical protein